MLHISFLSISNQPDPIHSPESEAKRHTKPAWGEQWPNPPQISTAVWTTSSSHVYLSQPNHVASAEANNPFQDLPKSGKVVRAHPLGLSNWCDTTRYDVELPDGSLESFFEKVRRVMFRVTRLQRSRTA